MNKLAVELSKLSERGTPRGADEVLAGARGRYAVPGSLAYAEKPGLRVATFSAAAAIVVLLGLGLALRNDGGTNYTASLSPTDGGESRPFVIPGELPFEPSRASFDHVQLSRALSAAPRLVAWARRSSDGSRVESAVGAEVVAGQQSGSLEVPPIDPAGRRIKLSMAVTATLTEAGYGRSGLTLLGWDTPSGERVRVAGRGLGAETLAAFAKSLLGPDGTVNLDQAEPPGGLSPLYDGPDYGRLAGLSGVVLRLQGPTEGVEISTEYARFEPLAGLWLEPDAVLVDVRGGSGILAGNEDRVSLTWNETKTIAISITVNKALRQDLLRIAEGIRLVSPAEWEAFLQRVEAVPTVVTVTSTTLAEPGD